MSPTFKWNMSQKDLPITYQTLCISRSEDKYVFCFLIEFYVMEVPDSIFMICISHVKVRLNSFLSENIGPPDGGKFLPELWNMDDISWIKLSIFISLRISEKTTVVLYCDMSLKIRYCPPVLLLLSIKQTMRYIIYSCLPRNMHSYLIKIQ